MYAELKKVEFQFVLCASSSHSIIAQGDFLLLLVKDFSEDDLPGLLPTVQVKKASSQQENVLVPR